MTFEDYRKKYFEGLSIGEARCKGIKAALDEALQKQDTENALILYNEFIEENSLNLDGYEANIIFPEYLALFEKHPELQDKGQEDLMRSYKLLLGGIQDYYEIPFQQIINIYEQYGKFCDRYNYNKRSYYRQMWNFMYWHGIDSFADCSDVYECHRKMMRLPVDDLSEIPAGECDDLTKFILFVEEDEEKALKNAEPIFSGKLSCPQVPLYTYINFAIFYFRKGDLKNAKKYIDRGYRIMHRDFGNSNSLTFDKGFCILIYAYIDPKKALQIFKKQLMICSGNKCGLENFSLYFSGIHTMRRIRQMGYEKIHMKLPDRSADIYNEDNLYSTDELEKYFYEKAAFIANRFDKRNGNSHFNDILNKEYEFDYDSYDPGSKIPDLPLLTYIDQNMTDEQLPSDFSLPAPIKDPDGETYADGEIDGISIIFEDPVSESCEDLEDLIGEIVLSTDDDSYHIEKFEKLFEEKKLRCLYIIDSVQKYILSNTEVFHPDIVYGLGEALAFVSNQREVVKLGLVILELFSRHDEDTIKNIIKLGSCDEFTFFAILALSQENNYNNFIFELAKKSHGWGRIHAINNIEPQTEEIKKWLLMKGIRNSVYNGYNAIACFEKSGAEELLKKGPSEMELMSIAMIIMYLAADGPSIGIHAFENEKEILDLFINNVQRFEINEILSNTLEVIGHYYNNDEIRNRIKDMGIFFEIPENETE